MSNSHNHPNYNKAAEELFKLPIERLRQIRDDFAFNDIQPDQKSVVKSKSAIHNICYDPRLLDKVAAAGKSGGYPNTEAAGLVPYIDTSYSGNMKTAMARRFRLAVQNGGDLEVLLQMGHNDCVGVQIVDQMLFDIAHGKAKYSALDTDNKQMLSALDPHLDNFLSGYKTFYHYGDDMTNRIKLMEATTAIKSVLNLSQYFTDLENGIASVISEDEIRNKLVGSKHRTYVSMAQCKSGGMVAEHDIGIRIPEIENAFPLSLVTEVYDKRMQGKNSLENGKDQSEDSRRINETNNEISGIISLEAIKQMYKKEFSKLK